MARPRKLPPNKVHIHGILTNKNTNGNSSSSGSSENSEIQPKSVFSFWKSIVGFACFSVAVYVGVLGYYETRVNTPFDDQKVVVESGLAMPERYWGSYRPGHYFGLKTREPKSPVFGLMWYDPSQNHKGIRHWCDQGDNLPSYGWNRHDGVTFGEQTIEDPPYRLVTSFIKTPGDRGGQWTARFDVTTNEKEAGAPISLIWYGALDEALGPAGPEARVWVEGNSIIGHTVQLGDFRITLKPHKGKLLHSSFAEANAPGLNLLKEKIYSLLGMYQHSTLGKQILLHSEPDLLEKGLDVNFVAIQMTFEAPFSVDVVYTNSDAPPLEGDGYTKKLEEKKKQYDDEFEKKFQLSKKGYSAEDVSIARSAVSNMVGGVGYFYGAGRVLSAHTKDPVPYWRAPLYTAVPSRSFFPRGFLWDEGFHGLLLAAWSPDIALDIAAHWFDLMNVEGWIPREQILGVEAVARVPKEFIVQNNTAANPPMFLLQLAQLTRTRPDLFAPGTRYTATMQRLFTRLQAWYQWFLTTQKGSEATSYRWRGREDDGLQLNPKTLTSGLDDYPRASHPSDLERHLDLRCWMYAAADSMVTIAQLLQRDTSKYEATRDLLGDENLLNELHWSSHSQTYADYGLHTDGVKLVKKTGKPNQEPKVVRVVTESPHPKFVSSAFGYVSLFPMLLKVLKPDSPKLGKILEDLDKPELLWSPYGLRSLSKSSPLFMKKNTRDDNPYWRGQVWLNINYLALASLKHYARAGSPRAQHLHDALRENLVRNVLSEYKRTGYLWEQYSSEDGKGSGCRPFTGWTALIVLIMGEHY